MKILVFHVNAHQKVTRRGRVQIRHILWTVSLLLQPSLSLPIGPMNKVTRETEMEVMHGIDNMDFHSPGYSCCSVPDQPTAEISTEIQIRYHSPADQNQLSQQRFFFSGSTILLITADSSAPANQKHKFLTQNSKWPWWKSLRDSQTSL